jgi:hypothetical protein
MQWSIGEAIEKSILGSFVGYNVGYLIFANKKRNPQINVSS